MLSKIHSHVSKGKDDDDKLRWSKVVMTFVITGRNDELICCKLTLLKNHYSKLMRLKVYTKGTIFKRFFN